VDAHGVHRVAAKRRQGILERRLRSRLGP
jgi:hypothetical protein